MTNRCFFVVVVVVVVFVLHFLGKRQVNLAIFSGNFNGPRLSVCLRPIQAPELVLELSVIIIVPFLFCKKKKRLHSRDKCIMI